MSTFEILYTAITAVGLVGAAILYIVTRPKPKCPCDTCEHLVQRNPRGYDQIVCNPNGYITNDRHSEPPLYCKNYKPREENPDGYNN